LQDFDPITKVGINGQLEINSGSAQEIAARHKMNNNV
jgi:hypothetical protein